MPTATCPGCSRSRGLVTMENGITKDRAWSLIADKRSPRNSFSLVSSVLNCSTDLAVVPVYPAATNNKDDKQWKNKFLKGLDADFNKYPNVEYLNLHIDSPSSETNDREVDKNCAKVDMSRLMGGKSVDFALELDKTASSNTFESSPLLQSEVSRLEACPRGRFETCTRSDLEKGHSRSLYPHSVISNNLLPDIGSKSIRTLLGPRKSDSFLHPPIRQTPSYPSSPQFLSPNDSPNYSPNHSPNISPNLSPNISPTISPHSSPRANRSSLSLNLPRSHVTENTLNTHTPPGGNRRNYTSPSRGTDAPRSKHSSTRSLQKTLLQNKSIDSGRAQSTQSIVMVTMPTGSDSGCNLDMMDTGKQVTIETMSTNVTTV